MSISGNNKLNFCLREARKASGFSSAAQASTAVPYSPETIGRHERGEIPIGMDDVIMYSRCYNSPSLLMVFCGGCPIRKMILGDDKSLLLGFPISALRVSNRLRIAAGYAERLETILDDGVVTDDEIPILNDILVYLKQIETVSRELLHECMKSGLFQKLKKHFPVEESAAHQGHSSQ